MHIEHVSCRPLQGLTDTGKRQQTRPAAVGKVLYMASFALDDNDLAQGTKSPRADV